MIYSKKTDLANVFKIKNKKKPYLNEDKFGSFTKKSLAILSSKVHNLNNNIMFNIISDTKSSITKMETFL